MTDVTLTDLSKSVRNRCVIEVFGGVFYVVTMFFGFFCGCMGVCHRIESDLFLSVIYLEDMISLGKNLSQSVIFIDYIKISMTLSTSSKCHTYFHIYGFWNASGNFK